MDIYKNITKIYDRNGFLEKYGGSLFMSIIIMIVFFILIAYFHILTQMDTIKQNWNVEKCNPQVIPFAGMINKPKNGSAMQYTGENFTQCMNNTLEEVADIAMEPVYYSMSIANDIAEASEEAINDIRGVLDNIREGISKFSREVMSRIMNIIMPIIFMFIKMKDGFNKVNGVMATSIFGLMGAYDTLKSLFNSIAEVVIGILLILLIIISIGYGLMGFFFTWPAGIAIVLVNVIFFVILASILTLIQIYFYDLMGLNFGSIPHL